MSDGDRSAVAVDMLGIVGQSEAAGTREHLGGESFIDFYTVEVVEAQADFVSQLVDRWPRSNAHNPRSHPGRGHSDDAGQGLQAMLVQRRSRRQQQGAGAIVYAGSIACGDGAVRAQQWF